MRGALLFLVASLASGCGVYVARGEGAYSLIGFGSDALARRCSPFYAGQKDAAIQAKKDLARKAPK